MAKYSFEFKKKVVKDYLEGKGGCGYLANHYGIEYSCAVKPPIRQTGNRLSGLTETANASLLA